MRHFLITIMRGKVRTVRNVIAKTSIDATLIGVAMVPEAQGPLSIFCKPL